MQPIFETERLIVRPRTKDDLEACLAMDRDPLVTKFIPGPWAVPDEHLAFVLARMNENYPAGMGYWAVTEKIAPDNFLGWIMLVPCDAENEGEIGWRFIRQSWGLGYATEAAEPVLRYALQTLKLSNIIAEIDAENHGSRKVAQKIGLHTTDPSNADLFQIGAKTV
ncbi:GNAT family N-acetyltransferase [Maritalea sp.]|uniref:GNAT family N-acetyltransferase n=1 Tax=Maritalea sp. TaxID=2003361 RepID=UPI003EF4F227